ncbi:hypothetical protein [Puia dinghuensis]|uniref:Uncharacterized protein n=1 Tax=Puia dinghuensis TaxID=1792502 RepID=A0A8J2UBP9_9BACT|nr:hypothetical protein [Puia dinghuensis]GGA93142.1 hypothetical protein GCM10011511_15690 [Puia dinghuensis]
MSTYNEYLHSNFKQLGFPNYIKMLDSEIRLKDMSFLFTQENLQQAPFFGRYNTKLCFAIIHPTDESGKRPYIGLIQSSLLDAAPEDQQKALIHNQVYYTPVPNRQAIIKDTIQFLEDHLRRKLSSLNRIALGNPVHELQLLSSNVRKR